MKKYINGRNITYSIIFIIIYYLINSFPDYSITSSYGLLNELGYVGHIVIPSLTYLLILFFWTRSYNKSQVKKGEEKLSFIKRLGFVLVPTIILMISPIKYSLYWYGLSESPTFEMPKSSSNTTSIYGRYDDFSDWKNGYTGFVDVDKNNWKAIIYYNNRPESSFNGKTSGSDLMDEYGMNRVGYIKNGTAYIVYMGGWVEIGK